MQPKISQRRRHVVRLKNGVAHVSSNRKFDPIVVYDSHEPLTLHKKPAFNLNPESRIAEEMAILIGISTFSKEPHMCSSPNYCNQKNGPSKTSHCLFYFERDEWEPKLDFSEMEDDTLRQSILDMIRIHLTIWNCSLGNIKAK